MLPAIVALSTVPDEKTAETIARALVKEKLAACVNIIPGVRSIYAWQGELRNDSEVMCVIKTNTGRVDELRKRLVALHPYEVPEFVTLEVERGHLPYLQWITDSVA